MNTRGRLQGSTQAQDSTQARASTAQERGTAGRLEVIWAWASLLVLVICWDAAVRLDQHVSVPRIRIAHAGEAHADDRSLEDRAGRSD